MQKKGEAMATFIEKTLKEFREEFELHDLGKSEFTLCHNNGDGTCDGGISIPSESQEEAERHLKKVEDFLTQKLEEMKEETKKEIGKELAKWYEVEDEYEDVSHAIERITGIVVEEEEERRQ